MQKRIFPLLCLLLFAVPSWAGDFASVAVEVESRGPGSGDVVQGVRDACAAIDGVRIVQGSGDVRLYVSTAGDEEGYAVSVTGVRLVDVVAVLALNREVLTPASAKLVAGLLQDRGEVRDSLVYRTKREALRQVGMDAALNVLGRVLEEKKALLQEIDKAVRPSS